MPVAVSEFSFQQYKAYLRPPAASHQSGELLDKVISFYSTSYSDLMVLINRLAYFLLHYCTVYPNNAYLFQQFKSHTCNKIHNEDDLKAAKEIFALFQQCSELNKAELEDVEEKLDAMDKLSEEEMTVNETSKEKQDLLETDVKATERQIVYCDHPELIGLIDATTYQQAVKQLPIVCVDIFLYNASLKAYLLVCRKNAPAKGMWWMPGGRMYKGESFFEAAIRKCWDEVKVKVIPVAQMGTYSTIFPDSEWGCQTHTINTVVLAVFSSESTPQVNVDHADYKWQPLTLPPPDDPYLNQAYQEGISRLKSLV